MVLSEAIEGQEYIVKDIKSNDEELNSFLFSLGCYSGESVTVISKKRSGIVLSVKDGRYSIDKQLSEVIEV